MSGSSGVKSFISETEVEEVRKKRQEEWEKVRQPEDPIERPEEVNDTRTLYEKLQEQKDKKQEEWEEQHKFKNMIRGLEGDETEFLDLVAKQQQEISKKRSEEESKEIKSFRSAASELDNSIAVNAKQTAKRAPQVPPKKSQMDLIAGGIKRRKSSSSSDTTPEKKTKTQAENNDSTSNTKCNAPSHPDPSGSKDKNPPTDSSSDEEDKPHRKVFIPRYRVERMGSRQSQTIPGMGIYSDSSDSESSSSDSEIISTTSFARYQLR